ncbi:hypothetical protein BDQ17DRAFT_849052 [Cyathus striatus]|nr:hypothetical protein BDQ17DRAFT_849052 [Cyathus striatus]
MLRARTVGRLGTMTIAFKAKNSIPSFPVNSFSLNFSRGSEHRGLYCTAIHANIANCYTMLEKNTKYPMYDVSSRHVRLSTRDRHHVTSIGSSKMLLLSPDKKIFVVRSIRCSTYKLISPLQPHAPGLIVAESNEKHQDCTSLLLRTACLLIK